MRYDAVRRRVTRLCSLHRLARIEIDIVPGSGRDGYVARAISEKRATIAHVIGSTIEGALKLLETALEKEGSG